MKVLVANIGSTSFKYRLFEMPGELLLARGGVERIGSESARCFVQAGGHQDESIAPIPDHAAAVRLCLEQLSHPDAGCLKSPAELAAIGFKAVHAKNLTGVHRVTPEVLTAMEEFSEICPAHNPPYVRAMRLLSEQLPEIPLVAAFETGFHATIPLEHRLYAVPREWQRDHGIQRWGFHGASHRYISERVQQVIQPRPSRVISCHLGGSSSLCAIRDGRSEANSLGMSPQSGLPQNNRVGDFDVFALGYLLRTTGKSLPELLETLANRSGLAGLSQAGNDLRDIEAAAANGNEDAQVAINVYVASVRHYLGAYLLQLGGADAIVFTGGIGENSSLIREAVCRDLEWFGIALDPERNRAAQGEVPVHAHTSRLQIWTMPTNEEIVVARLSVQHLLSPN